jgi:hypothetical protein
MYSRFIAALLALATLALAACNTMQGRPRYRARRREVAGLGEEGQELTGRWAVTG